MRHLCLAVVPLDRVGRLIDLDPDQYRWVFASNWSEAAALVRAQPIDVAMLDPMIDEPNGVTEVEQLRSQFPSIPLVLYTTLSPAAASVLLRLGRAGVRRVVFARFEDAPGNLRRALARELEHTALQQAIRSIDTVLRELPDALRRALELALHTPGDRMTLSLLAEHAHLSRHECEAWFTRAQLPGPRIVMALARLLYAHRLLLDPGHTVDDVASKLGYARSRTLQAHLRMAFGMTAGEARQSLTPEDAADTLISRYFTRSERPARARLMAVPG